MRSHAPILAAMPASAARRIIVNADDLGLCPSVNTAIFDVFRAGNLSSATLMVNMPGTEDAVERKTDFPGLAVGLHFCITEGMALTGASSLTGPDGRFVDRGTIFKRSLLGRLRSADVRAELLAQLVRMDELGVVPTHVDSHQHVHMTPGVFDAMLPVLRDRGLPVRAVAPPAGTVGASLGNPTKALKQWLNVRFAKRVHNRAHVPTNDVLVSIHDLDNKGPYDATTYKELVERAPASSVVEVMVHPYILGEDVLAMYAAVMPQKLPFLERCRAEHEALSGLPVFNKGEIITFADL